MNPGIDNYGDALWCALITIATVGYGDVVPVTAGGKVTIILEIFIRASLLTAFFAVRSANKQKAARRRVKRMDTGVKVGGHYLVCGWNQRARYVIERLKAELEPSRTPIVLLFDQEVNPCEDDYPFFVRGRAVCERDLKRANVAGMTRGQLGEYVRDEPGARLLAVGREGEMMLPVEDVRIAGDEVISVISEKEPPGAL